MCSDSKNYEEQRKKEKEEEDKRRNKIKEDRRRFEEKREKEYKEQRRVEVESRAKANAEEDQRRAKLEEERKESEEKRDQEYEARKKLKQEERRKKKEEDELREADTEERRRKFDEMQHLQFQELLLRKFEWALREDKYYYSSSESEEDDDEYLLEEYTLNADAHHGEGTVENGIPATSDVEIIEKQNGEIIENIISAKPNVENIVNIDPVNIDIDCEEYEMNIEKTLLENQSKNKDVETMPNNGKYFTDCIVKSISDQEIHIERICYEVKDSESNGDSGRLQNKSKVDFDCAQYSDSEILQYDFGVGPSGTESLEKDSRVDSEGYQMQGDRTIYQDRDNEPNLLITDSEYHQRKQSVCVRYTGRHEMKSNQRRDKMNETDGHRSQDHEIYSGREDNFNYSSSIARVYENRYYLYRSDTEAKKYLHRNRNYEDRIYQSKSKYGLYGDNQRNSEDCHYRNESYSSHDRATKWKHRRHKNNSDHDRYCDGKAVGDRRRFYKSCDKKSYDKNNDKHPERNVASNDRFKWNRDYDGDRHDQSHDYRRRHPRKYSLQNLDQSYYTSDSSPVSELNFGGKEYSRR